MAIVPSTDYAGQVETGDGGYPQGKAKNVSSSGAGDGTPLEKAWVNDIWGFFQELLGSAGIAPSGVPDEVGTSDYADALRSLRYNADDTIEFTVTDDTAYIKGPNPTAERQTIMRFGTGTNNYRVYYFAGSLEFTHNTRWTTGTGWETTGAPGVVTMPGIPPRCWTRPIAGKPPSAWSAAPAGPWTTPSWTA